MANQYTCDSYSKEEISEIISLYESGVSYSKISEKLQRKKANVKKILVENGVYVKNRDIRKKIFTELEIEVIISKYVDEGKSTHEIAKIYNVSISPIKRILKQFNVLKGGYSDGKKIYLSNEEKIEIKRLYLIENENCIEIGKILGYSESTIYKHIVNEGYIRSLSEATKLAVTGRKVSEQGIENMKRG